MTRPQADELGVLALAAQAAHDYRGGVAALSAPAADYGQMLAAFAGPTPEHAGRPEEIIEELIARATPGLQPSTGPRFFGWVIGGSDPTGVAADWLASAWGQNAGSLVAAPAVSAIEAVAAQWLLDILRLPSSASVGLVTGATVANFVCLAAARSEVLRKVDWDVEAQGLFGAPIIHVLIGADAHATVYSGLKYLGLGAQRVRVVATDDQGRMLPQALKAQLEGLSGPIIVIAQAGQINTGASDPFDQIAPICRDHGAWLHVDGAFGLWAQATPARATQTAGVEQADSWATDGHKWLQTPYDCGYAIVRDPEAHRRAMAVSASYLPPAADAERDPSAYVLELSRRARGVATWAMIRRLGRAGIADMVERCCQVAAHLAARLSAEPGVAVLNSVELNQFVVRFGDADAATLATIKQVQADGVAYMGAAQWRGQWVMRVSVSSIATDFTEANIAVDAVISAWRATGGGRAD